MILNSLLKIRGITVPWSVRFKSILSSLETSRILISSSNDIYTNLAIEHWLYTNLRFNPKEGSLISPIVFLWIDSPSVVIGKHQNPWIESTLGFVEHSGIKLARRFSGGGCVYHDENNINISIIGNREVFGNRQEHLKFLSNVLKDKYGIECHPTSRHDLRHTATGSKMSGSASRLGQQNSYHHFTLLVDSDKDVMTTAIRQEDQNFIQSNSTSSIRSQVVNLSELKPDLSTNTVIDDLAQEYGKIYEVPGSKKGGYRTAAALCDEENASLAQITSKLKDWEWIYGQTPRFTLQRQISLFEDGVEKQVKFVVQINKGRFESFKIEGDSIKNNPERNFDHLLGAKFSYKESVPVIARMFKTDTDVPLETNSIGFERVFATHLLHMIHGANF